MSSERMKDKVAVVTGGAAGIGRAVCARLAAEGGRVLVCDIDVAGGEETARMARMNGGHARFVELDVSVEAAWERAIGTVEKSYGAIDVLVNNAGLPHRRLLPDSSFAQWQHLTTVNAGGTFLGIKHGAAALARGGGGSIVNIASAAALVGVAGMTSYSAGKGAIRAMSRAAARECAAAGVRVNSIYPSSVRTSMVDSDARDTGVSVHEFIRAASALSPLGRIAEPDDVADAVTFLAGDESRFVTGAELVIDGGATAGVG